MTIRWRPQRSTFTSCGCQACPGRRKPPPWHLWNARNHASFCNRNLKGSHPPPSPFKTFQDIREARAHARVECSETLLPLDAEEHTSKTSADVLMAKSKWARGEIRAPNTPLQSGVLALATLGFGWRFCQNHCPSAPDRLLVLAVPPREQARPAWASGTWMMVERLSAATARGTYLHATHTKHIHRATLLGCTRGRSVLQGCLRALSGRHLRGRWGTGLTAASAVRAASGSLAHGRAGRPAWTPRATTRTPSKGTVRVRVRGRRTGHPRC